MRVQLTAPEAGSDSAVMTNHGLVFAGSPGDMVGHCCLSYQLQTSMTSTLRESFGHGVLPKTSYGEAVLGHDVQKEMAFFATSRPDVFAEMGRPCRIAASVLQVGPSTT